MTSVKPSKKPTKKPPYYTKVKPAKPRKVKYTCSPQTFHNCEIENRDNIAGVNKKIPQMA